MKLTEFYPEKQGRPESKITLDMGTRHPSIPPDSITNIMLKGGDEYVLAEDVAAITEAILARIVPILRNIETHLAEGSGETLNKEESE